MQDKILSILMGGLSVSSLLFLNYHTHFIAEYYKLFGLKGWKVMDAFIEASKDGYYINFPDFCNNYIKSKNRIITWAKKLYFCPFCLGFLINLPSIFSGITYCLSQYFVVVLGYLILRSFVIK